MLRLILLLSLLLASLHAAAASDPVRDPRLGSLSLVASQIESLNLELKAANERAADAIQRKSFEEERPTSPRKPATSVADRKRCQERVETEMDSINAAMRDGYSTSDGERYRERLRELSKQRHECGKL